MVDYGRALFSLPTMLVGARVTSLSVIIPAFNEAARLPLTLAQSLDFLREHEVLRSWELIVVDDGSTDDTSACVQRQRRQPQGVPPDAASRVRLLRSVRNHGKGAALAAGASCARGDHVLFMDADGGTPIAALSKLEGAMHRSDDTCATIVVGSRSMPRPWNRQLMGRVFRWLASTCVDGVDDTRESASHHEAPRYAGHDATAERVCEDDTCCWSSLMTAECGFKLLTREAAVATMPHLHVCRWAYDVELLHLAQRRGIRVASAAVPAVDVEGSKVRWHTPAAMMLDVLRIGALYRLGIWRMSDRACRGAVEAYEEQALED